MKKAFCTILTLALVIGLMPIAFAAASSDPVYGKQRTELTITAEQKTKMISLKTQLMELKLQIIKQNVENGTITQEQGKRMEEKINARLEALKSGKLGRIHRHHCPSPKSQNLQ